MDLSIETEMALSPETGEINRIYMLLKDLYKAVPLTKFVFKRQVGSEVMYDYKIFTVDSRVWKQILDFSSSGDLNVVQTFNVSPGWRLREFTPHRELRDTVSRLVASHKVIELKADFP